MKQILVTGKNSYIGTAIGNWLKKEPLKYSIDYVDTKCESFNQENFSKYDTLIHVAGIAHIKETSTNRELYYKVNRDLAYETAKKAKLDGVRQFIFFSSMSVYGIEYGVINKNTATHPTSAYGKSKLEAEVLIQQLEDEDFMVAIIRPPMVYGKHCKGNYSKLSKLSLKLPIFPDIKNRRSMIFIDNLSQFTKKIIDNMCTGVFFPQNTEYVCTSEMVQLIAQFHNKKITLTRFFNPAIYLLKLSILNKLFRNLVYDKSMSEYNFDYRVCNFKESIIKTENKGGAS